MASWQYGKLTNWQVDKIASWQNGKLTKWQVEKKSTDKMGTCQNRKLTQKQIGKVTLKHDNLTKLQIDKMANS